MSPPVAIDHSALIPHRDRQTIAANTEDLH